jgi:hypothetical protein
MLNGCRLCGKAEVHISMGGYSLPIYQGLVDYKRGVPFMVCKECYDKHEVKEGAEQNKDIELRLSKDCEKDEEM